MAARTKIHRALPKARNKDLLVEEMAGELIIYDVLTDKAHCLNPSAAAIWKHCDGDRSVSDLRRELFPAVPAETGEELVKACLERLRRRQLLEDAPEQALVDLSRRALLRKVALGAAAAGVIAPLISSVIAPTPAYAVTCLPSGMACTSSAECCTGVCIRGTVCL
jgi:hypothetical protein